ncbi:MAG: hypothetical protein RL404_1142 [Pseudomonadota bacterium]|jgi:hypothetical protein
MKGIVFREFIDMVENEFSLEIADAIIAASELSTDGAYTTVGTYPHTEMVSLVVNLSKQTGQPVPALLNHFGRHLFKRFTVIHPKYVNNYQSAFELLQQLDGNIHVEVKKLYYDAELPSFTFEALPEGGMHFDYRSSRGLADFAEGLIEGCIAHFGQPVTLSRIDLPADEQGAHTRFTLTRSADVHAG